MMFCRKSDGKSKMIGALLIVTLVALLFPTVASASDASLFGGGGTQENPYLIESVEDICRLRDSVNEGESFADVWFYQTSDLDMQGISWEPIGIYGGGNYFYGVYNGGGHILSNLAISGTYGETQNNALFGQLAGTVLNLGLEDVTVEGGCCGTIASHSVADTTPMIIQCYAKGKITGFRTGGIADNFGNGIVIGCWFEGTLGGTEQGEILSYSGNLVNCYGQMAAPSSTDQIGIINAIENEKKVKATPNIEKSGVGVLYVRDGVPTEKILPWQWNGTTLEFSKQPLAPFENVLSGSGSENDPYLIQNYEDICLFKNLVNTGNSFQNQWVKQTADITMETDDWTPIGISESGRYFCGIYDGGGYKIKNLKIASHNAGMLDNAGLFGALSGVVANLEIESGEINGTYCGSFASRTGSEKYTAAIINCYSNADITGLSAGGLVNDFRYGTVANCIYTGELRLKNAESMDEPTRSEQEKQMLAGIATCNSYSDTKIYNCYTTWNQTLPNPGISATSKSIPREDFGTKKFLNSLNFSTALTQELYGNQLGIQLMQWEQPTDGTGAEMGQKREILLFIKLINEYFPFILLVVILTSAGTVLKKCKPNLREEKYGKNIRAGTLILGLISLFVDCAAIGTANKALNLGNIGFIVLANSYFVIGIILCKGWLRKKVATIQPCWPLLVVMAIIAGLAIAQFGNIPRYDANVYYGSLVRGIRLFRLDLLTYLGAFVCWKWIHGTALLVAPLEFIFTGKTIGLYLSQIVIIEITIVVLYLLLREMLPQITKGMAAVSAAILVLCPYQMGMFTYFCLDTLLPYYAVWLMYSYKHKNHIMISFCGFLLCFTKISGCAFYCVFLVTALFLEMQKPQEKVKDNVMKIILWIIPVVLFTLSFLFGEHLTMQYFTGAYVTNSLVGIKTVAAYLDEFLQSFVFGFRWTVVAFALGAVLLVKKQKKGKVLTESGKTILLACGAATLAVFAMLCLYNNDADLPRYTAPLNTLFALMVPVSVYVLFDNKFVQRAVLICFAATLLIQSYWSIDPFILLHRSGVYTGTKTLHRLAVENDSRPYMNLGDYLETGYTAIGDLYAYNMEYNYYQKLYEQALSELEPADGARFYTLDLPDYDLQMLGTYYPLSWNPARKKVTFDVTEAGTIHFSESYLITRDLCETPLHELKLPNHFYFVVQARVEGDKAMTRLQQEGYGIVKKSEPRTIYGSATFYEMEKIKTQ